MIFLYFISTPCYTVNFSFKLYKLGGSYGIATKRVAQYLMRYATRGTHVPIRSQRVHR